MALKGAAYLKGKLAAKQPRITLRYSFYEMKHIAQDLGISTPPNLMWLHSCLGWCGHAVDDLADRLVFKEFDTDSDTADLNGIFQANNPDTFSDSAVQSALISSCCFAYIIPQDTGIVPKLQIIDGGNATGIIDSTTGLLKEGYAVLDRDDTTHNPTLEAYFEPYKITYFPIGQKSYSVNTNCVYPMLVPIIYRPDDKRPFGHSRINRAMMSLQEAACRAIVRLEVGSEFWSFPQKYISNLGENSELPDKWNMALSAFLALTVDDEGRDPKVGQFQASSPQPTIDEVKAYASMFAGESGLTLDDMGFNTDNPSSADAIKAAHTKLNLTARKAQRCFNTGLINTGMVAACARDNKTYQRAEFAKIEPIWLPTFEPDGASLGAIGDAIVKIKGAAPDALDDKDIRRLIGL